MVCERVDFEYVVETIYTSGLFQNKSEQSRLIGVKYWFVTQEKG